MVLEKSAVLREWITWGPVHGHVPEVTSLDDLDGQAAGGSVVGEADEQLGHAAVLERLRGGGAVTAGQTRHVEPGVSVLASQQTTERERNGLFNDALNTFYLRL